MNNKWDYYADYLLMIKLILISKIVVLAIYFDIKLQLFSI